MIRISIVIPAYNIESYIERCIRSVEEQDLLKEEFEVIVVNDGSTDRTDEILTVLKAEYSNLVILRQPNGGVSAARNAGIEMARGEYLMFVDGDDFLYSNVFGEIVRGLSKNPTDVAFLSYCILDEDGKTSSVVRFNDRSKQLYSGIGAYAYSRGNGRLEDPDRSWGILFRRQFICDHHLFYLSDVPYLEDGEFLSRILCLAKLCMLSNIVAYARTLRPGSAKQSDLFHQKRAIDGFLKSAVSLTKFKSNKALAGYQGNFINQPIVKYCCLAIQAAVESKQFGTYRYVIEQVRHLQLTKLELHDCYKTYKTYGRLYNLSPNLFAFYWIYKLISRSVRLHLFSGSKDELRLQMD